MNGFLRVTDGKNLPDEDNALAPHEVLLRRTGAPPSLTTKVYSADERLNHDQVLPDSDLLKAIHAYTSDFYARATLDSGKCDYRSMNETALLAIGILLEEAAVEVLGETGDMVLVEPERMGIVLPEDRATRHQVIGRVRPPPIPSEESEEDDSDSYEQDNREQKRRKYDNEATVWPSD